MSFILDALRKSENDRREQAAPALATAPRTAQVTNKSIWPPVLAVVLAVNALALGYLLLTRDDPADLSTTAPSPAEPEVRSLRKESLVDNTPPTPVEIPDPTPVEPVADVAVSEPPPAPARTIQEGLPRLDQLRAAGLVSVASIRVDMHVYSEEAAKRFVFINMKKYREGERLTEGPTIEEITQDGIIMTQQGNRFILDRD